LLLGACLGQGFGFFVAPKQSLQSCGDRLSSFIVVKTDVVEKMILRAEDRLLENLMCCREGHMLS